MRYRLMAVDIDGTLLDSSNRLTEGNIKAIRLGVEKGLIFVISSGRSIQGVKWIVEELGMDIPLIAYNGAMVVLGMPAKILSEQRLSPLDAIKVFNIGESYGTTIIVWVDNKLYVNKMNDRAREYAGSNQIQPVLVDDINEIVKNGASKILWYDDEEMINKYNNEVGNYLGDTVVFHTSKPIFLEFVDRHASKALAMEKLGVYYGIAREEMIAVGDGFNDVSMIEYAGLGVAMANAPEQIKNLADYVTLSNDEDGVAHVIYKYVLGK